MGVREIDRFLEQWQMDARDLHRQIILSPTPRYVRDALTRAGYAPIVTGNPEEVSRLMREEAPRLVLLDLMLPGTDGIILMKSIRETADVPVIFLSAYGQDQVIARALRHGSGLRRAAVPVHDAPVDPYVLGDDADEPAYPAETLKPRSPGNDVYVLWGEVGHVATDSRPVPEMHRFEVHYHVIGSQMVETHRLQPAPTDQGTLPA